MPRWGETWLDIRWEKHTLMDGQRDIRNMAYQLWGTGKPMKQAASSSLRLLLNSLRHGARANTGRYRASFRPDVVYRKDGVHITVGSVVDYAPFVEENASPHWPPPPPIIDWVKQRRLVGKFQNKRTKYSYQGSRARRETEVKQIAFLISRKISVVGTRGDHHVQEVVARVSPVVARIFGEAVDAVLRSK